MALQDLTSNRSDLRGNMSDGRFALIQFDMYDVQKALRYTSLGGLHHAGFKLGAKIRAVGAGDGKQDTCPVFSFQWNEDADTWEYAKLGSSLFGPIGSLLTIGYQTGGAVKSVRCGTIGVAMASERGSESENHGACSGTSGKCNNLFFD